MVFVKLGYSLPLGPIPPNGRPSAMKAVQSYQTRSSRRPLLTCALDQCVVGDSRTTLRIIENYNIHSKTRHAEPTRLPTFILKARVLREDVERERVVSVRMMRSANTRLNETHLLLMNSMASSTSLTGTIGSSGPNSSLYHGFSSRSLPKKVSTYSLINESSPLTPLMTVGAMNNLDSSVSPPNAIVPDVLSNSPLMRSKCGLLMIWLRSGDWTAPSG